MRQHTHPLPQTMSTSITLADLPLASSALIYIAEHQEYFSENDLIIDIARFESGVTTVIARFCESLSQAEKFLVAHPNEAKAIVRTKLEDDYAYIQSVWSQYNFSLPGPIAHSRYGG